jgi:hypothetical protein
MRVGDRQPVIPTRNNSKSMVVAVALFSTQRRRSREREHGEHGSSGAKASCFHAVLQHQTPGIDGFIQTLRAMTTT